MRGPGHNTRLHAPLPHSFLGMGALITSQVNVTLIRKLRGSLVCLAYFFNMLSMDVCTTRHWQTYGRLVQELNVCTVGVFVGYFNKMYLKRLMISPNE